MGCSVIGREGYSALPPTRKFYTITIKYGRTEKHSLIWGIPSKQYMRNQKHREQIMIRWKYPAVYKERILKPWLRWWYKLIRIFTTINRKSVSVHRLVAQAFIPNPENKPQVNHKNGARDDNRVENLERCTNSENQIHSNYILWTWMLWRINTKKSIPVIQYDKLGNMIKIWNSAMSVQREIWICQSNITNVCRWKIRNAWGFIWEYA